MNDEDEPYPYGCVLAQLHKAVIVTSSDRHVRIHTPCSNKGFPRVPCNLEESIATNLLLLQSSSIAVRSLSLPNLSVSFKSGRRELAMTSLVLSSVCMLWPKETSEKKVVAQIVRR